MQSEALTKRHLWSFCTCLLFSGVLTSCENFEDFGDAQKPDRSTYSEDAKSGLVATYFDNSDFTGSTLERIDPVVDFDWGRGSPDPSMEADTFSVRWTGFVEAEHSETYTFYTLSDDGVRLWVGGELVLENWTRHGPTENSGTIELQAGVRTPIKMEFFEAGGGAVAKLKWESPSVAKQTVPKSRLFPQANQEDLCPNDPEKTDPGVCGCGTPDVDNDGDGAFDCNDGCPSDSSKTEPGACGCGTPDVDNNGNGTFDCNDECAVACAPDQQCGIIDDGCGGTIECGVCGIGQTCQSHRCVEDNPGYQCDIACTDGKVLADYCQSPTTTSDEDACDQKRDLCCVDDMTPCPTLCGENKIFNDDVYLYWDEMTCGEYMDSLTPTDPACTNPLPHVPDECCSNSFPSSPPAAPNPCYDLCGDDLQLVGSRVLDEHMMTCFDYARSTSADDAQCTSPDPSIVDRCCDTPRPLPKPVSNYCCLCDGCYGTLSDRYYHKIGPDALTCVEMDYRITVDHKYGDAECSAKQEAFSATCCDANFDPPPEVPGEDEDSGQPNRCNVPDPPGYCSDTFPRCELCLDGSFPKKPYTTWTIAGVPGNPTCADLYWAGLYGGLPPAYCYPIRNAAQESCGCQ